MMLKRPTLLPYQGRALVSLLVNTRDHSGETFTVMFPRQAGKNEVSSWLVATLLLRHARRGGSVVVCAPTLYPQATISFERTAAHIRAFAPAFRANARFESNVIRCGAAQATFLSGSPEANVAGHTASLLLIGDEAQDLDADWFDRQFRPMTAATGASTVLFGTPWEGDSLLERAVERNRRRDRALRAAGARPEHPWHNQVGWRIAAWYRRPYGRHVRRERARLGNDHPIFRSQYLLQTTVADHRLLTAAQIWALEGPFGPLSGPLPGERYVAGLDFAGEGSGGDATVLTIGRQVDGACEVVAVFRWCGQPFDAVSGEVLRLAREWNLAVLVCDNTGLGAPLTAGLAKELGRAVRPLTFSRPEKSALGFELLAAVNTSRLRIAPPMTAGLRELWDELRVCRAERARGAHLLWSAPPGGHDDCVVSLALCLRACRELAPERIARGGGRR